MNKVELHSILERYTKLAFLKFINTKTNIIIAIPKLKFHAELKNYQYWVFFLLTSVQGSLSDFTAYSPNYNAAFMTTANADLTAIDG